MQIALNLEKTQDLIFRFEKNGTVVEKNYKIYSGASYSYLTNTIFTTQNNAAVKPKSPSASSIKVVDSVISKTNTPASIATLSTTWSAGALEGDRYLIETEPTGAWSGTYSVTGTSSIFFKKNSIAQVVRGLIDSSGNFVTASSTASVIGWTTAYGNLSGTWSYTPPQINDVVYIRDLDTNLRYDGRNWIPHVVSTTGNFENVSNFVSSEFYDQIKSIIIGESIFEGIDFIFETHSADSTYVVDSVYNGFLDYDKSQKDNGLLRNYNVLSVKYKSEFGDLKVDISRIKPTFSVEIKDFSSINSDLEITLGATGLNPPFQWSFTYSTALSYNPDSYPSQSFTTSNHYILPDTSGTNLVFNIKVVDSVGLTSSIGYYSRNSNSPISINGTFSYTTL